VLPRRRNLIDLAAFRVTSSSVSAWDRIVRRTRRMCTMVAGDGSALQQLPSAQQRRLAGARRASLPRAQH
jgi:hypothetical protein